MYFPKAQITNILFTKVVETSQINCDILISYWPCTNYVTQFSWFTDLCNASVHWQFFSGALPWSNPSLFYLHYIIYEQSIRTFWQTSKGWGAILYIPQICDVIYECPHAAFILTNHNLIVFICYFCYFCPFCWLTISLEARP